MSDTLTKRHDADLATFLERMEEPHRSTMLHTFANFSPSTATKAWEHIQYRTALQMAGWVMETQTIMVLNEEGERIEQPAGRALRHSPERQREWAEKLNLMHPTDAFVALSRLAS